MPLHLLGKKSWNVYNADNVAKVRQDEAAAAAAEHAAEERMQEEDAARRTAILRGEVPPPILESGDVSSSGATGKDGERNRSSWDREERKRSRRKRGEDDTDRDIRLAREDAANAAIAKRRLDEHSKKDDVVSSITDSNGHIQLFSGPDNDESRAKKKRKPIDESEQGIRFGAQGTSRDSHEMQSDPWYASSGRRAPRVDRDAFGRPDAKRTERDAKRIASNDPMAAMKRAQGQLKRAERERGDFELQRVANSDRSRGHDERDRPQPRKHHHHSREGRDDRRHRHAEESRHMTRRRNSLEGFSL